MSSQPFLAELRRRHVVRVTTAYAIAAWLIVQVATQLFPYFGIPDWAVRLVVLLLVIGLPVAVAFAWIYELTPEGLRRTAPIDSPEARSDPQHHSIGQKLNVIIIVVLALAVAVTGWRLYTVKHAEPDAVLTATTPAAAPRHAASATQSAQNVQVRSVAPVPGIPAKSVAVLPFVNESGNKDEQFFSDGLSEDLITALSQFAGLKVISRSSAFQFRDSKDTSAQIGKLLGVAHLLEGSVQRAADEVRITATLVNAADGSVLWTQRYDKPYKDLFALQDAITQSVADALKAKLLAAPGAVVQSDRPPSGNLDAYIAYQHGIAYSAAGTEAGTRTAVNAFTQATRLDPKYSAAYAELSTAWANLAGVFLSGAQVAQARAKARNAANTALTLDPSSSLAHQARGYLLLSIDMDWRGARAEYQRALHLSPNDPAAQFGLGKVLASLGQNQRAVDLTWQALASDPRHASWHNWMGAYLTALDQLDDAEQAINTSIALQPGSVDFRDGLVVIDILRGDAKAALQAAQKEPPGPWHDIAMALALQIGPDHAAGNAALAKLIREASNSAPYQIAEAYAVRKDPDEMFNWLDRAWTNRDPGISQLLYDPLILRYRNDPRFAAFCKKVGLPTTTDAVAMQ